MGISQFYEGALGALVVLQFYFKLAGLVVAVGFNHPHVLLILSCNLLILLNMINIGLQSVAMTEEEVWIKKGLKHYLTVLCGCNTC